MRNRLLLLLIVVTLAGVGLLHYRLKPAPEKENLFDEFGSRPGAGFKGPTTRNFESSPWSDSTFVIPNEQGPGK